MIDRKLLDILSDRLFATPSSDRLFNPYHDLNPELDRADAPEIRRSNLLHYLAACSHRPDVLVVAEAPGPHGCRFSGVPFTSEEQLLSEDLPFSGRQSSLGAHPKTEYSSRIVWGLLAEHFSRIVIWSTVPLHPHKPGAPMSIRTPSVGEAREWSELIPEFQRFFRPRSVAAVGRVAERACGLHDIDCTYVRHPSQGGANAFREGMARLLS
ncbi:uracil-DNA glycosylase [Bacteroidota bacterium]